MATASSCASPFARSADPPWLRVHPGALFLLLTATLIALTKSHVIFPVMLTGWLVGGVAVAFIRKSVPRVRYWSVPLGHVDANGVTSNALLKRRSIRWRDVVDIDEVRPPIVYGIGL